MIEISDPQDPRLSAYHSIKERDLIKNSDRFIAEGKVVLNVLLSRSARFSIESLLILENKLSGIEDLLQLCPADVPVYVASQPVIDKVAGFHLHRGILAVGVRKPSPDLNEIIDSLPKESLVVALCGISNHDNIGSIFRNAAAFEADAVLMDRTCCDPLYRKAIRVSVGATLSVPYFHDASIEEIVATLQNAKFEVTALSPSGSASIYDLKRGGRRALLLGTEGAGLPPALLAKLNAVRIPMSQKFDSLNVATASGIALSHFSTLT